MKKAPRFAWRTAEAAVATQAWIEAGGVSAPHDHSLVVAAAEVVDEHLFYRLVVGHQDVADSAATDYVADFFSEILGVISGAFERLGHEDDLQAGLASDVFRVLDVAQEDEVAQAVDLGIGAENVDGFANIAGGESGADIGQHFFQDGGHVREVA